MLSRGYHSLESGENDEKLVLDRLCPGISQWQNPDRVAGANQAKVEQPELDALVLDDAFQHRRIERDLDIVLIDATNPWGYGYQLPRGLLRESRRGLQRADVIVITRADLISELELSKLKQEIKTITPDHPVVVSRFVASGWLTLDGPPIAVGRNHLLDRDRLLWHWKSRELPKHFDGCELLREIVSRLSRSPSLR